MKVTIPYTPRPLQAEIHRELDNHRFATLVMHRRAGKTVMAINHLLKFAIQSTLNNPRCYYIGPSAVQAKRVAWDYICHYAAVIPDIKFNHTELRCDLPNGARIGLLSAETADALRGIYIDFAVFDEYALHPQNVFPEIVRPALSDRKGKAIFVGTPAGHDAFFDLYQQAMEDPEWYTRICKASETEIIDLEELKAARSMMTVDQYNQEFECSFEANIAGAIYGKEMTECLEQKRITHVPYDPTLPVDTYWDLGIGDKTAIIFVQQTKGGLVRVIDCYAASNEGLPHYADVLDRKGYQYGQHNAPHDIEVREMGSGKSRREIAYDLGINFRVVPKLPLEDGIHAAQMLLPKCVFDIDTCSELLDALRQYHRAYNQKTRTFRNTPVHDASSHYADAMRYCAVGIRELKDHSSAPQTYADNTYNPLAASLLVHS